MSIAPASGVIEYEEIVFEGGFFTKANEFMGFPTRETDKAWEGLYNCKFQSPILVADNMKVNTEGNSFSSRYQLHLQRGGGQASLPNIAYTWH